MIDLYNDLKYKQDCENKMKYSYILNNTVPSDLSDVTITGSYESIFRNGNTIFVVSSGIVTIRNANNEFFKATKLSAKLTKFVI
jgi:hypothetical protein